MRNLILLSFFISSTGLAAIPSATTSIEKSANNRTVRVLLGNFQKGSVSGYDLIINSREQMDGQSYFSYRCQLNKFGEARIHSLRERDQTRLDLFSPGGYITFEGKLYRNQISVIARGKQCLVINTLDLEKYLAGLINKEMSPSWPLDALKAQAVASRTYALYQMEANKNQTYDLESTTADQVYAGASTETSKSNQATLETKGEVLAFAGSPIKAYFHANCGGKTEAPEFVWGQKNPAFRSVFCPYHREKKDKIRWEVKLTKNQILHALQKIGGILPKGFLQIAQVEAGAPNANQRFSDLMISDPRGNSLVISANAFRNAIGNTKFRSTSFQLENKGSEIQFVGEGFGHGVGMCQVGARAMAQEGKNYRDILNHYYPLAQIAQLSQVQL